MLELTPGGPGADRARGHGPGVRGTAAQADDPAAGREPAGAGASWPASSGRRPGHGRRGPGERHARVLDRVGDGRHRGAGATRDARRGRRRRRRARSVAARPAADRSAAATASWSTKPAGVGRCGSTSSSTRLATLPDPLPAPAGRPDAGPRRTGSSAWPARPGAAGPPRATGRRARPALPGRRRVRPRRPDRAATRDGHHSGEVSFPGGKAEPDDADIAATALREAAEEVALDADAAGVRVVGLLDRVLDPGQRLRGHARSWPSPTRRPVARRRRPPRSPASSSRGSTRFLPDAPIVIVERTIRDWPLRYGAYDVDGLSVWGATARILSQLGAVLARSGTRPFGRRNRSARSRRLRGGPTAHSWRSIRDLRAPPRRPRPSRPGVRPTWLPAGGCAMRKPLLSLAVVALVTAACGSRASTQRRLRRSHRTSTTTTPALPAARPATPYDGVTFEDPGINPYVDTDEDRVSTFAMDVDTASYTIAQRYVADGNLPDPGQRPGRGMGQRLRPGLSAPPDGTTFAIVADGGPTPFTRPGRGAAPGRHPGPRRPRPGAPRRRPDVRHRHVRARWRATERLELVKDALAPARRRASAAAIRSRSSRSATTPGSSC